MPAPSASPASRPSEAIGAHFSRFYAEEARETHWPEHELAVAARDGRSEDEGWRFGKGGERFWAHTEHHGAARCAPDAARLRQRSFVTCRSGGARRSRLAHNEERLRALLTSVRDYAIIMLDPNGIIVSWSEGAQRIKGYRAEEIIGAHFSRFYPPEAIERGWPEHELRVAATEGHFEDEDWRVRKDGSRFWANVVITALRDRNSRLIGFSQDHARSDRAPSQGGGAAREPGALPAADRERAGIRHLHARCLRTRDELEQRRPAHHRLRVRRDPRQALLALLPARGDPQPAPLAAARGGAIAGAARRTRGCACARTAPPSTRRC